MAYKVIEAHKDKFALMEPKKKVDANFAYMFCSTSMRLAYLDFMIKNNILFSEEEHIDYRLDGTVRRKLKYFKIEKNQSPITWNV